MDLRISLRTLANRPGFAAVAILTLGLGIGAATALYSVVDGVLLRPLPYDDPDALVAVHRTFEEWREDPVLSRAWDRIDLSYPEFQEWREVQTRFEAVAAYRRIPATWTREGTAEIVQTVRVSPSFLPTLGLAPVLGRGLRAGEEGAGATPVALISHGLWRTAFGQDPAVLERTVTIDGRAFRVVGVLPPEYRVPGADEPPEFMLPAGMLSQAGLDRRDRSFDIVGRLAPGVSPETAEAETAILFQFDLGPDEAGARLARLKEEWVASVRGPLMLLLAGAGLLLLMGCASVANMLLSHAGSRTHEMAARMALGAERMRLVRQLLTESAVLAAAGAVVGILIASGGVMLLVQLAPPELPRADAVAVDLRSLGFATAAAAVTTFLFGLAPAFTGTRVAPALVLRAGPAASGRRRSPAQSAALGLQVGLAALLLIGATLLSRSLHLLSNQDPGFEPAGLVVATPRPPSDRYEGPEDRRRYYEQAIAAVAGVPGVQAVSAAYGVPFVHSRSGTTGRVEGAAADGSDAQANIQWRTFFPGAEAALGLDLVTGRTLDRGDNAAAQPVVLVNQALVEWFFPTGQALGKRVWIDRQWREIVGVIGNVHDADLAVDSQPTVYLPYQQTERVWAAAVVARVAGSPSASVSAIRDRLRTVDAAVPIADVTPITHRIRASYAAERFRTVILVFFALAAGLLAAAGVFGVTRDTVERRMREMAIRVALGATDGRVVSLAMRQAAISAAAGLAAALLVGLAAGRVIEPFLFGVNAADPWSYAAVFTAIAAITALSAWVPARRSAAVQPARLLRD